MTKSKLIDKLWVELGAPFTKRQVTLMVDALFKQIELEILNKNPVKICNFGTFLIHRAKKTVKVLPGKSDLIQVPHRNKLKFFPSSNISKKLMSLD